MPHGLTLCFAAFAAGQRCLTGLFEPIVISDKVVRITAECTNFLDIAGVVVPGVREGASLSLIAGGAGLGRFAGGVIPAVAQCLAFGLAAFGAGSGCGAGGIVPAVETTAGKDN